MGKSMADSQDKMSQQNDDEIDLLALLATILRGWKIILAFAILGLMLGIIYSRYVLPTYKTDAMVQIEDNSKGISALGADISDLVGTEASPAETERELIKSRMIIKPVVDKLHLDIRLSNPQIGFIDRIQHSNIPTQNNTESGVTLETEDGIAQITGFEVPRELLNHNFMLKKTSEGFDLYNEFYSFTGKLATPNLFTTEYGDIAIQVTALPETTTPINILKRSLKNTVDSINSSLSVSERGKSTGIVQLSMTGPDQQQVTRILREIVQSYVDQNLSRGSEQTTTTIEFMEQQIPTLKGKLEAAEESFNQFREQNGTIDVTKEAEILLNESAQIESQLSELNLKKAELLTYYTTEHPLVVQINDQLSVLLARKNEIEQTISKLPDMQKEFLQLSEDMGINREIYLTMLKNYEQLKIARASEIGYVRIIDMPINTFEAIAPKKLQIWILSLLLGTMLGTMLALLKGLLRKTVKDPEQLEVKTGIPVIATIPRSKLANSSKSKTASGTMLLTGKGKDDLTYEGIKSLRTSLMFTMPKIAKLEQYLAYEDDFDIDSTKLAKIILITGEAPGIGKSFITSNLAETFTQLSKRVLIIDGDMRRGQLHKVFTATNMSGLGDYLTDIVKDKSIDITPYVHKTSFDLIDFMPRGSHPQNPASLLAGDYFVPMLVQLATEYDYIFIDTPPILAASDAIIMSQYADTVLMITKYDYSIEGQVAYAAKRMQKNNVTVDGIVLNDMTQGLISKYNYHYNYAYGKTDD